jgi:phosphatidate phosphatase PAH1
MSGWTNKLKEAFAFNSSGRTGAIDAIVVQDECGCYRYSQFHVRISKFRLLYPQGKTIQVFVNNKKANYDMKISKDGVGFFEYSVDVEDEASRNKDAQFIRQATNRTEKPQSQNEIWPLSKGVNVGSSKIQSIKTLSMKDSMGVPRVTRMPTIDQQSPQSSKRTARMEEMMTDDKRVQMSICAHLISDDSSVSEIERVFARYAIDYATFCQNPNAILENENLMLKIDGQIYDSYFGLPQVMSLLAFDQELDEQAVKEMLDQAGYNFMPRIRDASKTKRTTRIKKSFKPPADFFEDVELITGLNTLEYRFVGNFGQSFTISSRLFFYPYQKQYRILISDIDGTITKSDILGHIMPFIYQDWSQLGIAQLYTNLCERGYIIVYLSSRNIDLSQRTINLLKSIKQGEFTLPDGPVLLSSDDLFHALNREMIVKNPETFKISVLRDLKQLFEHSLVNPLYAGFGNKDTDAVSYMVVGIPKKRIFTINCEGEIFVLKSDKVFSYTHLHQNVNEIFPIFSGEQLPEDMQVNKIRYSNYNHKCLWSKAELELS